MIHIKDVLVPLKEFIVDHPFVLDKERMTISSIDSNNNNNNNNSDENNIISAGISLCQICDKYQSLHQLDSFINLYSEENQRAFLYLENICRITDKLINNHSKIPFQETCWGCIQDIQIENYTNLDLDPHKDFGGCKYDYSVNYNQ